MIGAINGAAVTGGLELALHCDLLVASERASFGDTHARVGILPGWGLSCLLPRAVGYRTATLLSITGNFLTAADAFRLGMVATVVAHDELLPTARRMAADIVSNDQGAVRAILAGYRAGAAMSGAEAVTDELERAVRWQGEGFDAAELARRRAAIVTRGRSQAS